MTTQAYLYRLEDLLNVPARELGRRCPDCADLDEDCPGVEDKANCWLYAPERGMCPYLRG
jgi:hypothetical protein